MKEHNTGPTFTSQETQELINFLKNNHLQLKDQEDMATIGYMIRHVRGAFKSAEDKNKISLDYSMVNNQKFLEIVASELKWLTENDKTTEQSISICEKIFDEFTPEDEIFKSEGLKQFYL